MDINHDIEFLFSLDTKPPLPVSPTAGEKRLEALVPKRHKE